MNKEIVSTKPETQLKSIADTNNIAGLIRENFMTSHKGLKTKIFDISNKFNKTIPSEIKFNNNLYLINKYIVNSVTTKMKTSYDIENAYTTDEIWNICIRLSDYFKKLLVTNRVSVVLNDNNTDKRFLVYIDRVVDNVSTFNEFNFLFDNGFFKFSEGYHFTIVINLKYIESLIKTGLTYTKTIAPKEWFSTDFMGTRAELDSMIYRLYKSNVFNSNNNFSINSIVEKLNDELFKSFIISIYVEQLRLNNNEIIKSVYSILNKEYPKRYSKSYSIKGSDKINDSVFSALFNKNNKKRIDTIKNIIYNKDIISYPNIFDIIKVIYSTTANPFILHELIYESVHTQLTKIFQIISLKSIKVNELDFYIPTYSYLEYFETNLESFDHFINILKYNRILPTIYLSTYMILDSPIQSPLIVKIYNSIKNLYLKRVKSLTRKALFNNIGSLITEFEVQLNAIGYSKEKRFRKVVLTELYKNIFPDDWKSYGTFGLEELDNYDNNFKDLKD